MLLVMYTPLSQGVGTNARSQLLEVSSHNCDMGFLGVFGLELSSQSWPVLVMLGLYSTCLLTLVQSRIHEVKPPLIGRRYLYEPRWVFGFRFMRNSSLIIQSGYEKAKQPSYK